MEAKVDTYGYNITARTENTQYNLYKNKVLKTQQL